MINPWEQVIQTCDSLGIKPAERVLSISIGLQKLQFIRQGKLIKSYLVSTSRRPPSNIKGSMGTPRGLHEIAERIGAGQPIGMVFKGRVPLGRHFSEFDEAEEKDGPFITSRILWLNGLQPEVNRGGEVDSHDRYIYIHGTNREENIGQPQSGGCILMRNLDIIEMYEDVRVGDRVLIMD